MHYKTNRVNHDFQIAYFIAGSCQTADAAYAILCDLKEDRSTALKTFEASKLREQAKMLRAERMMQSDDPATQLDGQADLAEIGAFADMVHNNYRAAVAELEFIQKCQDALLPYRKYAHLPDAVAHEAAQQEEWMLQLVHTAENHILSGTNIPQDHWGVMRMHPDFGTGILPALEKTRLLIGAANMPVNGPADEKKRESYSIALTAHLQHRTFKLPELPKQLTSDEAKRLTQSDIDQGHDKAQQ